MLTLRTVSGAAAVRRVRRVLVVAGLACVVLGAAGGSSALAASPWWHLSSVARPSALAPGAARNDAQTVTVTGTAGEEFVLIDAAAFNRGEFKFTRLPVTATRQELQTGLEAVFGAGNVEVSGAGPFTVSFQGAKGSQWVRPMLAFGPASVAESVHGRPDGEIAVIASNLGDAPLDATTRPVVLADTLPPGLRAVSIEGDNAEKPGSERGPISCDLAALACEFGGVLPPFWDEEVVIGVDVEHASTKPNEARVSGGTGPENEDVSGVTASHEVHVGDPAAFGLENYELIPEEENGVRDAQAGSHPFQLTTAFALNQALADPFRAELVAPFEATGLLPQPVAMPKDFHFRWPPGLIGNATALPQCPVADFTSDTLCPPATAVGVATNDIIVSIVTGAPTLQRAVSPVFNLVPEAGEPARFAFHVGGLSVYVDPSVRTGSDYGVTVSVNNITQAAQLVNSHVTVWGVPGDKRHDISRGQACLEVANGSTSAVCNPPEEPEPQPFLTMPSSCTGPLLSRLEADSWVEPQPVGHEISLASAPMPAMDGCNRLPFSPSIQVKADSTSASSPSGLTVDVHVPQAESLNPTGLAEADPRTITVALPPGVQVNPAGGDGLAACPEAESAGGVGFTGFHQPELQAAGSVATFTEALPEPLQPGLNFCPDASKIGTAEIVTPLLPVDQHLKGSVYLATQNANPFGSLIAMYIVASDPGSGIIVKLAGQVQLCKSAGEQIAGISCAAPGQLITTVENSPQAPFQDAILSFFGGERAPLATPARCGAYTTNASFTPWSAEPGEAPRQASDTFNITSGPNGGPCPGATLPFTPSLTGGTTSTAAAAFSPLSTTIARQDGNQNMQSVQLHMAPGMSGILTGVPLCPEAQANEGTCGAGSEIGETTVSAGVGSDPVSVTGGRVYLTEKYAGAPFGLSIVNPVKAGPFDLEHDTSNPANQPPCDCVVVRAKIEIDPLTAALTITTDPSGPHAIPRLIDGIPVQIQKVNVLITRPGFIFNPTNCNPMAITGTITGDEGATSPVSVPFQAHDCATLKFAPKFQVSTTGKSSRAKGASLTVKLSYPAGAQGTEANIARVKVELPRQLPSQLKTLQKACLAAVFEANPAGCPAESIVGHATVHTPLLPVPLTGPAYFVSHGGEAFPDLTLVLQGYGVTVDLVGSTFISKAGVTSSTFKATPDVPFNAFELTLPQGKYAALTTYNHGAAGGSLCGQSLTMPTEFRAQNGAEIHQSTPITVTGCPAAITVVRQRVKGKTATIQVRVPGAGKLVATAKGLSKASKTAKGATTLTLELTLTNAEAVFLGKHKTRKLKAKVNLQFTPKKGGKLKTSTTVILG